MNEIKQMKEKQINDYISNKLLNEDDLDIDLMKEELGSILGEKPGIDLDYQTESMILEDGKSKKRIKKLDSISIFYTYNEGTEIRFGTLKYLTD